VLLLRESGRSGHAMGTLGVGKRRFRLEFPTVGLALAVYVGWVVTTSLWRHIPSALLPVLGGWFVAWHASLQHEVIHGHPSRLRRVNDAIGWLPLSLWLPYEVYRRSHLRHHNDETLTDPIEDPESAYLTLARWQRMGPVARLLVRFDTTLLGRLLIGPAVMIGGLLASEAICVWNGDHVHRRMWFRHLFGIGTVLAWMCLWCEMPLWLYVIAFVYPGAALTRLRSYAEHRWSVETAKRTAIVERAGIFGLLFLNNNLHVLHHARPNLPWYALPSLYAREREALLGRNGGLVYNGYLDIAGRFLLRAHDDPVHPSRLEAIEASQASSG
jgi:fatty acid desaturase